jgi:neuroligin
MLTSHDVRIYLLDQHNLMSSFYRSLSLFLSVMFLLAAAIWGKPTHTPIKHPLHPDIECPSNTTIVPTLAATRPQNQDNNNIGSNSLLRRLTSSSQYQSYATALTVTIAVGCFLLLLNVFIFAAIYYQREKRATYTKKKEELTEAESHHHSSSSPSLERYQQKGSRKSSLQSVSGTTFGEYSCYDEKLRCKEKRALADLCTAEMPMQEYKYSPPCGSTNSLRRSITPEHYAGNKHPMMDSSTATTTHDTYSLLPTYAAPQINDANNLVTYRSVMMPKAELCNQATQADSPPRVHDASTAIDENDRELSPLPSDIPPPPRSSLCQSGILRQGSSSNIPATPGTAKKRVQIQEISV